MRRVLWWGLAAIALSACSSSTSGGGSSVSPDKAATDVANALCARFSACSAYLIQAQFGDMGGCQAAIKVTIASTLAASGTGYTPSTAESCAAKVPGASCDSVFGNNLPTECQPVAGTLANGAACGDSSQCKSSYCNTGANSNCGACGTAPVAGATCMTDADCPAGSTCGSTTCVPFGAAGTQCDGSHPCLPTLTCKNGSCATPDEPGASCTQDPSGGLYGSCDALAGAYCEQTSNMCAKINLAQAGEPCGQLNGTFTLCARNGACAIQQNATMGTCQAAAPAGASCDLMNGPTCLPPANCENGVCTTPNASSCH